MVDIIPSSLSIPQIFNSGSVKLILISSKVAAETSLTNTESFSVVHGTDLHAPLDLSFKPSSGTHFKVKRLLESLILLLALFESLYWKYLVFQMLK